MVERLGLEEHDGIGIADGGDEERAGRARPGGNDHLESGDMRVELLLALRVVLERADAAAIGHAHDHLAVKAALRALAIARRVVLDLVEALEGEAGELDLADRLEPVDRHAHRGADDARLREGTVDDAGASEDAMEVLGDAEDAAVDPDVLADDEHVGVALHLLVQRQVERLDHVQFCHRLLMRCPRIGGGSGGSPLPSSCVVAASRASSSARSAASSGGSSA